MRASLLVHRGLIQVYSGQETEPPQRSNEVAPERPADIRSEVLSVIGVTAQPAARLTSRSRRWRCPIREYACLAALLSASALAGNERFVPAYFTDREVSLQNLISFPKRSGDISVIVMCDARIAKSGRFDTNNCFARDNTYRAFERAIDVAARHAIIRPAEVEGQKTAVYFQYAVSFEKKGDVARITAFPHQFRDFDRYGLNYTGPQRFAESESWVGCRWGVGVWISMVISEQGLPSDLQATRSAESKASDRCIAMLVRYAASGKFIPAMLNGKPVPARYLELFWSSDVGRL